MHWLEFNASASLVRADFPGVFLHVQLSSPGSFLRSSGTMVFPRAARRETDKLADRGREDKHDKHAAHDMEMGRLNS